MTNLLNFHYNGNKVVCTFKIIDVFCQSVILTETGYEPFSQSELRKEGFCQCIMHCEKSLCVSTKHRIAY